jgi:hypothetical protein
MKISSSEDYWRRISAHTHARLSDGGAPWSVLRQVAALVSDSNIEECAPTFAFGRPSVWTIDAVTEDRRLVRVRMEFDAEKYDFECEQRKQQQKESVAGVVHESSARRLSDVVSLDIAKAHRRLNGFGEPTRDEFNVGGVSLKFNNGDVVNLGFDQTSTHDVDERARSDALLEAVRRYTKL